MTKIIAWALYDLANTFFAIAMVSFFFPLWLMDAFGVKEVVYSVTLGVSMACVAVVMPFCGALSDALGTRMLSLRIATCGCALATCLIGLTQNIGWVLVLFGLANFFYQLGTIFYDSLMWGLTKPEQLGQVSGIGAACGYIGSALGLLLLWPFVQAKGYQAAFIPSALFFLLFALPSFFLIHDPARRKTSVNWSETLRAVYDRFLKTVRSAKKAGPFWQYLWAAFFSWNAIQTVLIFMVVYVKKVMGWSGDGLIRFFLVTQVCAVLGALLFGKITRHLGAKNTLCIIWAGWMIALGVAVLFPSSRVLWVVGPCIGLFVGSSWATSRVLITELAPKEQLTEMFGLSGLVIRVSSILGPMLWGLMVLDPAHYHRALLVPIALLAIGLVLLARMPYKQAIS